MIFWKIEAPEYDSDYDDSYVNGEMDHPYGLPGVICDKCGQTWGGSRILPFSCPDEFKSHKNIADRWPIPVQEMKLLCSEIQQHLRNPDFKLKTGDSFQPAIMSLPTYPEYDFLWPRIGCLVVSQRIMRVFLKFAEDVSLTKVVMDKIGKCRPILPAPIPSTGEPEDIINEVEFIDAKEPAPEYYEVCINSESSYPENGQPISACQQCGREDFDRVDRRLLMTNAMWNGQGIFFLKTTALIIVTDQLKTLLQDAKVTNCAFIDITDHTGDSNL